MGTSKFGVAFFGRVGYNRNESKEYKVCKAYERSFPMELAKVTSKGQITIPIEIRRKLGVKEGDKLLFVEEQDGRVVIMNSSMEALRRAQKAFAG